MAEPYAQGGTRRHRNALRAPRHDAGRLHTVHTCTNAKAMACSTAACLKFHLGDVRAPAYEQQHLVREGNGSQHKHTRVHEFHNRTHTTEPMTKRQGMPDFSCAQRGPWAKHHDTNITARFYHLGACLGQPCPSYHQCAGSAPTRGWATPKRSHPIESVIDPPCPTSRCLKLKAIRSSPDAKGADMRPNQAPE